MRLNILHITPDFNYACGRSYYVYLLLKYFSQRNHNPVLITNGGDSLERLEKLGIKYKINKSLHSKNPVSFAKNVNEIKNIIKDLNIDIVHTHHRYSELTGVRAGKLIRDPKHKSVFTALSIVKRKYNIEYKSDKIIAVSKAVKRMLINKFNINPSRIKLIPNFTDTDELKYYKPSKSKKTVYNIFSAGRFHPEKNYEILLEALNYLNDKNIKLTLIGEGANLAQYQNYINSHKLNAEILTPRSDLSDYFAPADVCVLSSKCDPFPNFMLQAGLFKKPFIGSKVDGISELIINNKNGLLFEPGDYKKLAENIILLKENKMKASSLASALHSDVITHYTQKQVVPEIEKLYLDLLKSEQIQSI
jgi:glycosyltransferase involved in cell wall biosynthesis